MKYIIFALMFIAIACNESITEVEKETIKTDTIYILDTVLTIPEWSYRKVSYHIHSDSGSCWINWTDDKLRANSNRFEICEFEQSYHYKDYFNEEEHFNLFVMTDSLTNSDIYVSIYIDEQLYLERTIKYTGDMTEIKFSF